MSLAVFTRSPAADLCEPGSRPAAPHRISPTTTTSEAVTGASQAVPPFAFLRPCARNGHANMKAQYSSSGSRAGLQQGVIATVPAAESMMGVMSAELVNRVSKCTKPSAPTRKSKFKSYWQPSQTTTWAMPGGWRRRIKRTRWRPRAIGPPPAGAWNGSRGGLRPAPAHLMAYAAVENQDRLRLTDEQRVWQGF
jgi:hypothetical protein